MSARTEYEMSVHYCSPEGMDEDVENIAERFGMERVGSGGGLGGRDLHFQRDTRPSDSEIEELKKALTALDFPVWAGIEVWVYDENGEVVQDEETLSNETIDLVDLIPENA